MKILLSLFAFFLSSAMSYGKPLPQTLLEMSHVEIKSSLSRSVLILIDYQNEYVTGKLPLWEIDETVKQTSRLLERARKNHVPVIHVIHDGGSGGLFDLTQNAGQIIEAVKPIEGEIVIKKKLPNAFSGTELKEVLHRFKDKDQLIIAGLMTHMCVSSTVSSAADHGYVTTVIASTTTTRDLKDAKGKVISASDIKRAALATLKDRFSLVLNNIQDLQD